MKQIILCIIAVIFFVQCNKDEKFSQEENNNDMQEINLPEVYSKNGLLNFKDRNSLSQYTEKNYLLNLEELTDIEEEFGFLSQKRIFDLIVEAENIHDELMEEKYAHIENKEVLTNQPEILHSEIYYQYLKSGTIREFVDDEDGSSYMNYSAVLPELAPVLNIDGLYAIQDTLYQITENSVKIWYDADLTKLETIKNATETDSAKGIFVNYIGGLTKSKSAPEHAKSDWNYSLSSSRKRARILLRYLAEFSNSKGGPSIHYSINTQYQQKNWLGNWKFKDKTDIYVWASWSLSRYWLYGSWKTDYVSLNPNPMYSSSANNWWFSVNPETGQTVAPANYFYLGLIPKGSYVPDPIAVTDYYWGIENFSISAKASNIEFSFNTPGYLAMMTFLGN